MPLLKRRPGISGVCGPWRAVSSVLLLTGGLLAGCTADRSSSRRQSGDTTFVYSAAPQRDTATLREVLRIGDAEGPDEYLFTEISNFAIGPDGDVFVADYDGGVRQFSPAGAFVRHVARNGRGPGEVTYITSMDASADGRLAVVDLGNQRISIYGPDGSFERQLLRPTGRPAYGRDGVQWNMAGDLWVGLHLPRTNEETASDPDKRPIYGRLTEDRTVADTVTLDAWGDECGRRDPTYARGFYEDRRVGHGPFFHWTRGRSGDVAVGCSADYAIDVRKTDGTTLRVGRAWSPVSISEEQRVFHEEYAFEASSIRPAFVRLWLSDDGRLWVRPGTAGESRLTSESERSRGFPDRVWTSWSSTDGMDVFAADGAWIGHVPTPANWVAQPFPGSQDPYFRGDTIWAVTRDELGVTYLSRFVVDWPEG
ncbi:6-bladed beta-propeller [Gaopeijia maritima]|uniref:6-bladed beta-propeller n=1 Tax=Gaopeijia maritima TaxID=3119007 RepID=A0ABU9E523_9BACT